MKLSVFPRTNDKKSDVKKLRREGQVPGVLYGVKKENQNVYFPLDQFQAAVRQIQPGMLSTTVFELNDAGKAVKAIVKEVQYHPVSYAVLHVDFSVLSDNEPVALNVPIKLVGVADCAGVKLGGFMRQVIRALKVRCLPKDIPQNFTLDVRSLAIGQSMTLADIELPSTVRPLAKMREVAVIIAKKG